MFKFRKQNTEAKKIRESKPFNKAEIKAKEYIESPDSLTKLVENANKKAKKKKGPLIEVWDSLMTCLRLVRAYSNGTYREIPWQSLVMIIASIIYFVMPADLIPDLIAGVGYLDDASLLAWTISSFASDIEKFKDWEATSA